MKAAIDKVMATPDCIPGVKFEEYREVGSFKKDTALTGHTVADIVIIMQTLPTFEAVAALGNKLAEELRAQKEVVSCVSRDYGCLLAAAAVQMLVRVLKDIRRRHTGLQPLSVWVIEYMAHFAVMNTSNRQPLPLGPAFRRVFEALATGIFLPGSPTLFDPTEPGMRIAYDLSFEDMDLVCSTAQTLLRVICNGGHAAVLGMDPTKLGTDLSKEVSVWNGVAVSPLEVAYVEDCMKPKFCEADELLEQPEAVKA
ncbi:unnamed protein product [Nippostrongylus brasiliensis]|uniref:Interleukin enhancer-binding factor 2 (inferred by orthology to a human protein) n=1 Tax=Nippostrongylus brasiliensis TaxID=27835 RepID=A0A158R251_NIPBR|nr:unnamed protein product [Nippostrongylus brasiliensis]